MKIKTLEEDELYRTIDAQYNPPSIRDPEDAKLFQAEIRAMYSKLLEPLEKLGTEGDYYGVSDYAIRPDLRDRLTTTPPPAPRTRQFIITFLSQKFYRSKRLSAFFESLYEFLSEHGCMYRIRVDQDFDSKWCLDLILTLEEAAINCTDSAEEARLRAVLQKLSAQPGNSRTE